MTYEELRQRQNWSLYQKIDHTIGAMESFISYVENQNKSAYISFSGGKDSTILLDIVRRFIKKDFKAVFCNTGNEWPDIIKFVSSYDNVETIRPALTIKEIISRHGFPLISKEQAYYIDECRRTKKESVIKKRTQGIGNERNYAISLKWMFLLYMPFCVSAKCCEYLKKAPFKLYEKKNNSLPILGTMAVESQMRKRQYVERGGCNSFSGRIASHPLSIWTDNDIFEYSHKFNIPLCNIYNIPGVHQTGCMFCGFGAHLEKYSRFERLYRLYPKAYATFMNYSNNGYTYRDALRLTGVQLPDENRQLEFKYD